MFLIPFSMYIMFVILFSCLPQLNIFIIFFLGSWWPISSHEKLSSVWLRVQYKEPYLLSESYGHQLHSDTCKDSGNMKCCSSWKAYFGLTLYFTIDFKCLGLGKLCWRFRLLIHFRCCTETWWQIPETCAITTKNNFLWNKISYE